jgi:hypothetical protein
MEFGLQGSYIQANKSGNHFSKPICNVESRGSGVLTDILVQVLVILC